jgi:hypothetical protein
MLEIVLLCLSYDCNMRLSMVALPKLDAIGMITRAAYAGVARSRRGAADRGP